LVGFLSDKINTRFGKRMPWYFFGTILVIPTFFGIFSSPSFVNQKDSNNNLINPKLQILWYILLPSLFNMGWAAV
jgi:Na+/melibiose symporter-like transporter